MATTYTNIEQLLVSESSRIGDDIYRKTVDTSPWLKLVKQDAWPDEMGDTVSVLVYERSLPYNTDGSAKVSWNSVSQNGAAYGSSDFAAGTNTLNNTGNDSASAGSFPASGGTIDFGQTLRTYGLSHAALESPNISLNDLRFPMKRKEQLANIMQILTESTSEVWIQRYRDQYISIAQNKLVATTDTTTYTGFDTTITGVQRNTTGSTSAAQSSAGFLNGATPLAGGTQLTQTILDRVYMDLLRNGAGANAYDRMNGAPVFLAIMSPETSDSLIRANADIVRTSVGAIGLANCLLLLVCSAATATSITWLMRLLLATRSRAMRSFVCTHSSRLRMILVTPAKASSMSSTLNT